MSSPTDPTPLAAAWRTGSSGDACPDTETLLAFDAGELQPSLRVRLAAHVARCGGCAAALQALAGFSDAPAMHAAPAPVRVTEPRRRLRLPAIALALAASLLLAVLVVPSLRPSSQVPPLLRGTRSVEAVQPPPRAHLTTAPRRLQWRVSANAATARRVRLLDAQARELWRSEPVTAAFVDLPEPVRALLQPGASYAWELLPERDAAAAGPFWFTVQP